MPPHVAQTQIVVIPIFAKKDDIDALKNKAHEIASELKKAGLRAVVDDSDRNPGFKFNAWELKGTPMRFEIGPKDF